MRTKLKASLCENRTSSQQLTFDEYFHLKKEAITRLSARNQKKKKVERDERAASEI